MSRYTPPYACKMNGRIASAGAADTNKCSRMLEMETRKTCLVYYWRHKHFNSLCTCSMPADMPWHTVLSAYCPLLLAQVQHGPDLRTTAFIFCQMFKNHGYFSCSSCLQSASSHSMYFHSGLCIYMQCREGGECGAAATSIITLISFSHSASQYTVP